MQIENMKTRNQLALMMYKLNFNQLSNHQRDMVDYEFKMQF